MEKVFEEVAPSLAVKKEQAKKLYDYYSSRGWQTSKGVPVSDLRALVSNWLTRKKEFEARGRRPKSNTVKPDKAVQAVRGAVELDNSLPDDFNPFD